MFGSQGERELQQKYGSQQRAERFYDRQVQDHLTEKMQSLIRRQEMVFVATADAQGNCDCSPRFGKPGFVTVIDEKTVAYPEFRGNGVLASLGNIHENPHIGLVFVDFLETTVGLHVNGSARICGADHAPVPLSLEKEYGTMPSKPLVERWVVVEVEEAYIHCSKHVPLLRKMEKHVMWGTDDPKAKSDDYFVTQSCG
ncbi:MAG: pyridoxamine 5'-phosphate oxidase family protein [Nitrospinae bacterium]|nr:pyridoxamine 5'-phosphate oxidase family protein [Nitrospinota bacterium]